MTRPPPERPTACTSRRSAVTAPRAGARRRARRRSPEGLLLLGVLFGRLDAHEVRAGVLLDSADAERGPDPRAHAAPADLELLELALLLGLGLGQF